MSTENQLQSQEETVLPLTRAELDEMTEAVCERFEVPPGDVTSEAVATAIMHMPAGRGYAPIAHFGNFAIQAHAKEAALEVLNECAAKRKAKAEADKASKEAAKKEASANGSESVQNP